MTLIQVPVGFTANAGAKDEEDLAEQRHQDDTILLTKGSGLYI
jgi:hypothetical protein